MRSILSSKKLASLLIVICLACGCAKQPTKAPELVIRETPQSGISTDQKNFEKIRTVKAYGTVQMSYKGQKRSGNLALVMDMQKHSMRLEFVDLLGGSIATYKYAGSGSQDLFRDELGLPFSPSDLMSLFVGYYPDKNAYSGRTTVVVELADVLTKGKIRYPSAITVDIAKKRINFKLNYSEIEFNKMIDEQIFE